MSPQVRPQFCLSGGATVPLRYRTLRALTRGPLMRRLVMSGRTGRLVLEHLPAMEADYGDGRTFGLPAGDRTYARVFFLGEHEPDTSEVMRRLVRSGDFAIDVGANHGWFALLMAQRAGDAGEVWAIEPLPAALPRLRANLSRSAVTGIRVLEFAVGAEPGRTRINSFSGLPHVHASASTLGRDDFEAHVVPRHTLDGLLAERDGVMPSLVKVDVEGGELDVLRGAERLLGSDLPPIWVLEVNRVTAAAFGFEPAHLLAHLRAHGPHDVYRIGRGGALMAETDPSAARHGINWLCVPVARRERLGDRGRPS